MFNLMDICQGKENMDILVCLQIFHSKKCRHTLSEKGREYRHTLSITLNFIVLWHILSLHFLQTEGLLQPCMDQVYQALFFPTAFTHFISVSHIGNSHNI